MEFNGILFYSVIFPMFERIRRFIPIAVLSLAVFSAHVSPGCVGNVWLLIDAFVL